jgi:hypothetical protein
LFNEATDEVYRVILDTAIKMFPTNNVNTETVYKAVGEILDHFLKMGTPEHMLMATDISMALNKDQLRGIEKLYQDDAQRGKRINLAAALAAINKAILGYREELGNTTNLRGNEQTACRAFYMDYSAPVEAAINQRLASQGAAFRIEVVPYGISAKGSAASSTKLHVALQVIDEAQVGGATGKDGKKRNATMQSPLERVRGAALDFFTPGKKSKKQQASSKKPG